MAKDGKKRKKDKDNNHDPKPPKNEEKGEQVENQKKSKKKNKKQKLQHDGDDEMTLNHGETRENHDKTNKHKNKRNSLITDPRFASAHSDPRFQRLPKRESKVVIDSRFNSMFSDKNFASSSAPVDKRGKPKKGKEVNPLLHYYLHQEEKEEKEGEGVGDEKEEEVSGGGSEIEGGSGASESGEDLSSSTDLDDDDDDDDDDQDSVNSDICRYLTASHEDTPLIEQETHRLAVVNMDWDHIKAVDLFVVMSSCLPKGGQILSVGIYPSEFGLKCMEVEAVHGPSSLLDDNEDSSDDESKIDDEKLRAYELNKLRYYFAVVVCDSGATANHIYKNLDGTEFLRTSNVFDLRFVPDTMEFKHSPRDITTEAPIKYKEPAFQTRALQHSSVKLTWEEDEPHRTKILRRKFNPDQLDELNEYLASSGESDDGHEKVETDEDEDDHDGDAKKRMDRERLRALLLSEEGSGSDHDDDKDMEITFNTGLEDLSKRILEKKDKKSETVWEQVLRKRNEKKKARKNWSKHSSEDDSSDFDDQEATDQPDDFFMEEESLDPDPNVSKGGRSSKKGREVSPDMDIEKEASRAELELLFAEDQEGKVDGHKGYNLKAKKKGKKGENGKEVSAAEKLSNVDISNDPRFSALFTSPLFALDPTDPQFKRSATYIRQRAGKPATTRKTEGEEDATNQSGQEQIPTNDLAAAAEKERFELSSTVRSLKRNLGNARKESKGR